MGRERLKIRSDLANAVKDAKRNPDDPAAAERVQELRAQYQVVSLEEHVRSVVDKLPRALTEDQRTRLAALLRPSETEARAA